MEWGQLILFLLRNWNTIVKPVLDTLHITDAIDEILNNLFLGADIMEDKNLYFENKDTTRSSEIKATYDKAVEGNYKFYRAVSKKGKFYYWDENNNCHKLLPDGVEWAENPHYIEPSDKIEEETAIDAEIEPVEPETEVAEEIHEAPSIEAVEAKTAAIKATVEKTVPLVKEAVTDYKALYEQLEKKYAEQEAIALAAVAKMNKYKNAMKKAAEIMIDAIGD